MVRCHYYYLKSIGLSLKINKYIVQLIKIIKIIIICNNTLIKIKVLINHSSSSVEITI